MALSPNAKLPQLSRTSILKASFGTCLGYGPAGGGKTKSVESLVNHGLDPFIIACELGQTHGLLSLAHLDIPFVSVYSQEETLDVIRALKRKPGKVEYDGTEFGCVVLDSITQWGEFPLERYIDIKGWDDLATPVSGGGKDPRLAYGYLAEKGRQLYKELFGLPAHLYIIAREARFGDGTIEAPFFDAPDLPGQKLSRELPGWPDATVRLRVINGAFKMVTKGEGGSPARVRLPGNMPALPSRCEPDIGALMKYLCGDRSAHPFLVPPKDESKPGSLSSTRTAGAAPALAKPAGSLSKR